MLRPCHKLPAARRKPNIVSFAAGRQCRWSTRARQLFFGFHIGNTQVSFAVLLASVIVFGLAYAAARIFEGWLDAHVLKPAGISGGVRDSIAPA